MNTNRINGIVRSVVLALAGTLVLAGLASAQTAAGKFTLPYEARWGLATLPPGDYSFKLDQAQSFGRLQLCRGGKNVAMIRAQSYSTESSGSSALTVVRASAGNTVSDLSLPDIGVVLHYAPHKSGRASAEQEREIAQKLPVDTSGK